MHVEPGRFSEEMWGSLHQVDLCHEFQQFVPTLDECPFFLRSALRTAHTQALRRLRDGYEQRSEAKVHQGWTLFLLTSRMLLARPQQQGEEGRDELLSRARRYQQGAWLDLLAEARQRAVARPGRSAQQTPAEAEEGRLQRACHEVRRGAPSRARQAWPSAP